MAVLSSFVFSHFGLLRLKLNFMSPSKEQLGEDDKNQEKLSFITVF